MLCFCRFDVQEAFRLAIVWAGFEIKSQIIWDRMSHGMGDLNGEPAPQHDVIWFATKGKFKLPGNRPKSVVRHMRLSGDDLIHPNEKPVPLMADLIESYSPSDALVLDCFAGSGSTLRAAKDLGRRCIGIEIEERYCEIAANRLAQEVLF